jgi:hypothetical protein
MQYITDLPPELVDKPFPKGILNRNIRDVLAHLYHWHQLFLKWYEEGMAGKKPAMPAPGYTWKETPRLNVEIQQKYQSHTLNEVMNKLMRSHFEIEKLILRFSDKELFTKKRYKWTGTTSLGAYMISATSSHYEWALKLIKKCHQKK